MRRWFKNLCYRIFYRFLVEPVVTIESTYAISDEIESLSESNVHEWLRRVASQNIADKLIDDNFVKLEHDCWFDHFTQLRKVTFQIKMYWMGKPKPN